MSNASHWYLSWRADPVAARIADRHYNRQKVGSPQFVPPGRCIVLRTKNGDALWVSSWPFAQYVKHAWAGAWMNSTFRNESNVRSSELIKEAVRITRQIWGDPPSLGFVTFIDEAKIRHKRDPGRCYLKAGFRREPTRTKSGLVVVRLWPEDYPPPLAPLELPEHGQKGRVIVPRAKKIDDEAAVVGYFQSKPVEVARATLNVVTAMVKAREPQAAVAKKPVVKKAPRPSAPPPVVTEAQAAE